MLNKPRVNRGGFAAIEALFLGVLIVMIASLLAVVGAESRAGAGLNRDLGNLRQIGQWTFAYASDFHGTTPTLSAAPDSQWSILRPIARQDLNNGARHAIDIIRRRTGRHDFPAITSGWFAHLLYSHLALIDYVDGDLPDRTWIATGDIHRMNWTDDPIGKHDLNFWQPFQQPPGGTPGLPVGDSDKRWPYSASFNLPPAWYDVNQSRFTGGEQRVSQGSLYNQYIVPGGVELRGARLSEIAFPSSKVMQHDSADHYHGREARHYGVTDSRVAMLMADGSGAARATIDSNPGWDAQLPTAIDPDQYTYAPRTWEAPTSNGGASELIAAGWYRWTRGGLKGRDFGGAEIDTGQR